MRQSELTGRPLPDSFQEIDDMTEPWIVFFVNVFMELSTERPASFDGVAPLPISKIREYATHYDFNGSSIELFKYIITAMDAHYLKGKQDEIRRSQRKTKAFGRGNRGKRRR